MSSMKSITVDVAVIGAGSAGLNARRGAFGNGAKVVMIEGGIGGTTCARVGCMPSKALIAAADVYNTVKNASDFHVDVGTPSVDTKAVMERVRRFRDRFTGGVRGMIAKIPAEQKLTGWAKFTGPNTLVVGDETEVAFKSVVIATGSTPWIPPPFDKLPDSLIVTTDSFFELPTLPRSLAVLGCGVIGLELGQAVSRLGIKTTFFDIVTVVGPFRDEMADIVKNELGKDLEFKLGVRFNNVVENEGGGVVIKYTDANGKECEDVFDQILCSTGRRPNVSPKLNMAAIGNLELNSKGMPIKLDERTMQAGNSHVFFAGDVTGTRPVLHEASDEGRIAGSNAASFARDGTVRAEIRRTPLHIVFTHPQMAICGEFPPSLDLKNVEIGEFNWKGQSRALIHGEDHGHVRLFANPCGYLLGAELFGPNAEHHGHLLAWAIQNRLTVDAILDMPFYHPVTEEGIRSALRDLAAKLKLRPKPVDLECGPAT